MRRVLLALAVPLATGCHHKHVANVTMTALPPAEVASMQTSPAAGEPQAAWGYVSAPMAALRSGPAEGVKVAQVLPRGTRVAVRARTESAGVEWDFVIAGEAQGWTHEADLSPARVAPAPAAIGAKRITASAPAAPGHASRIDARALDEAASTATARTAARDPADDLATLQLAVDALYLDPTTWQPSPVRRKSDAQEFRRGLE